MRINTKSYQFQTLKKSKFQKEVSDVTKFIKYFDMEMQKNNPSFLGDRSPLQKILFISQVEAL